MDRAAIIASLIVVAPACHACHAHERGEGKAAGEDDDHDEDEEQEEQNARRLNYWRVQVKLVGQGVVASLGGAIDCSSDPAHDGHACGPQLFTFEELQPPLLRGTGARGWKLARWESQTRQPDGTLTPRAGPMPDGRWYLDGFGYRDTGALETVTAVFVPADSGSDDVTPTPR